MEEPRKLYRSRTQRMVAGVCGGLAEYFNVDTTVIRVLFLVLTLFGGSGLVIYLVMWILVPDASKAPPTTSAPPPGLSCPSSSCSCASKAHTLRYVVIGTLQSRAPPLRKPCGTGLPVTSRRSMPRSGAPASVGSVSRMRSGVSMPIRRCSSGDSCAAPAGAASDSAASSR